MGRTNQYTIHWKYFPCTDKIPNFLEDVVNIFQLHHDMYSTLNGNSLKSNEVLKIIESDLEKIGYTVEHSKSDVIKMPVLFGEEGIIEKSFDVDAYNFEYNVNVEVEAGRGVSNYQFLKDLFEACLMIDAEYLVIAVRLNNSINNKGKPQIFYDYEKVKSFFESLYASTRMTIPLKGVLIIGY